MKRLDLRLSRSQRLALHTTGALLFLTGIAWTILHRLDQVSEAGETLRRWKSWSMTGHGLSAVGFVFVFGSLVPIHVYRSWRRRRNRLNGLVFLTSVGLLVVSGYALYYLAEERWRAAISAFHLWAGAIAPLLLIAHIRGGRKSSKSPGSKG